MIVYQWLLLKSTYKYNTTFHYQKEFFLVQRLVTLDVTATFFVGGNTLLVVTSQGVSVTPYA
jgi:hypothetical protein